MAKEQGWIKLHRKIMDSDGYFDEAFTRTQAWIDMLLLANHSRNSFRKRGIKIFVERGQIGYSEEELGKRWKWSRGKVRRFLDRLEEDKMIATNRKKTSNQEKKYSLKNETDFDAETEQQKDKEAVQQNSNVTTLISIINYERYQGYDTADDTANRTTNGTTNGQQTVQQTDTNKNDKECIKNDKEEIIRGEGDLPPLHATPAGLTILPSGEGFIEPMVFFTKEHFNGLPKENNDALRRLVKVLRKVEVGADEVSELWEVFKVNELTFQKPYRNKEDVFRHFTNWAKKQTYRKGASPKPERQKQGKGGKVVGVEFINDFTQCRMSDDSIQDLDINQQDSARFNHINPKSIVKR